MPHADSNDLAVPLGRHLHRRHDFQRCVAVVFVQRVGRSRHPEHQRDLLHQAEHGVLAGVAGGCKIFPLHPVKFLHHNVINGLFFWGKGKGHLMDAADLLARDLLKGAGDDRLSQDLIQLIGIVDVLGSLTDTEYCSFSGRWQAENRAYPRL